MSNFRRHISSQSIQSKRAIATQRATACVIETLEERQLLSLTIDVRLAGGGKAINVSSVDQVVNLQVWAVVTGSNPATTGFQEVIGSFLSSSTAPGSVLGNMTGTPISPFTDLAAQTGESQDLDGDGDLDLGSNDTSTSDNYFFARDGGMDFNGVAGTGTNSFEIGTLSFTVTSLVFGQSTNINFLAKTGPSFLPDAIWKEDGNPLNDTPSVGGILQSGAPVVVTSNAAPPVPTGAISGTVFEDTNGNGSQNAGESGIAGVGVYIDTNNNGKRDPGEEQTTTDSNGHYTLTELPAGSYIVRQIVPSTQKQTTPASGSGNSITLTSGQIVTTSNFADMSNGTISGLIYNDNNVDGTQEAGEGPVSGVTVYLDTNNNGKLDSGERSTTTDSSGDYSFSGLSAGTYIVRQVIPSLHYQTAPLSNGAQTVKLSDGQAATGINFGDIAQATISGTVTNNGAPMNGVTVYIDANKNGSLDSTELRVTTNSSGQYTLPGLLPSPYLVRQVVPTGDTQTTPASGTGLTVSVAAGAQVTGQNFVDQGAAPPTGGSITGTVFSDANGNGKQDAGELGIAGVTVYNDANNSGTLDAGEITAVTNASGVYSFSGLSAGAYLIRQLLPSGDKQTLPANGFGNHVTLATNQAATGINFGDEGSTVQPPPPTGGSIGGTVFTDVNGNGKQDAGDTGIANVTVYNDANNNGKQDAGEVSTVTAADGTYTLSSLSAGAYLIRQILPAGDTQDFPTQGFGNHVTLATNQVATGANFGDQVPNTPPPPPPTGGSISGTVFTDVNGNGKQDVGDTGIANVTVYNDANNNGKLDAGEVSTVTAADGTYTLSSLSAGAYLIRQILPSGDTQDFPTQGFGNHVTLATNQVATGANFGDQVPNTPPPPPPTGGSISGTVFTDVNGNGKQDSGDTGIAGVTVYNDANNNGKLDAGEINTVTAANGTYTLSNLPAGAYLIRQILPSGDKQIAPGSGFGNHVTLATNQVATGANFADQGTAVSPPPPTGGSISGTVTNASGPLANVLVYIDVNNDSAPEGTEPTAITNSAGQYSFSGLSAGTYLVRQVLPSGETQTTPTPGNGFSVVVASGAQITGENFIDQAAGSPGLASISGTVFNDANGNGKFDAGESGISSVVMYIDMNNQGVFISGDPEVTANASGVYDFTGLAAGTYIVRQIIPKGDTQTTPTNNFGIHVTVGAGQASTGNNFGDKA